MYVSYHFYFYDCEIIFFLKFIKSEEVSRNILFLFNYICSELVSLFFLIYVYPNMDNLLKRLFNLVTYNQNRVFQIYFNSTEEVRNWPFLYYSRYGAGHFPLPKCFTFYQSNVSLLKRLSNLWPFTKNNIF